MKDYLLRPRVAVGAGLGLVSLIIYTITLAPDVLAHDSGEWQAAGATLGISHAPGSPAYTIVTWLFSLVPIGSPAARVDFVSAVSGMAGVVAVYALMLVLLDRLLPAVVSAVTLAVAGLWWSHASVATPYNAIPALIAILLILLMLWSRNGDKRLVWAGALLIGLGLAWHLSLIFFLPVLLAGVFVLGPWRRLLQRRVLLVTAACLLAGLGSFLYLPLRSAMDPSVQYSRIDSPSAFLSFVTHSETRGEGRTVLRVPSGGEVKDRLIEVVQQSYYPSYAFLVFGPAIILFYPAVWPKIRNRRAIIFVAAGMIVHVAIVFSVSGVYAYAQYYMPLLLYFSLWAGFSVFLIMSMGEAYLERGSLKYLPVLATGAVYLTVLLLGVGYKWDFVNHREDTGMRKFINSVFSQAETGGLVLAEWDSYTGLLYAQKVEGKRPDLKILPASRETWRDTLQEARAERPESQVLFSPTLPYDPEGDLTTLVGPSPLSTKGRTYQDFFHGQPAPAAVMLFELGKPGSNI